MNEEVFWPAKDVEDAMRVYAPDGDAVLVGIVVIADWMLPSGRRTCVRAVSAELAPWQRDGLLEHAKGDERWDGDVEVGDEDD